MAVVTYHLLHPDYSFTSASLKSYNLLRIPGGLGISVVFAKLLICCHMDSVRAEPCCEATPGFV